MNFLLAHWGAITVAAAWLTSHLRKSIPARGTPKFLGITYLTPVTTGGEIDG